MYEDIVDERGKSYLGLVKLSRAEGDIAMAREWAIKALAIFTRGGVFDCIARCNEELARLCDDKTEARKYATMAREAFVHAELDREVQRIDEEFFPDNP